MMTHAMKWEKEATKSPSIVRGFTLSARVHVVDADPSVFDLIADCVRTAGLVPIAHTNAFEFASEFSPDALSCVVLDAGMRKLDGFDVLREVLQKSPETPVIIVSDDANVSSVIQSMRDGATDFLEKPIYADQLFDRISSAIELARSGREKANRRAEVQDRIASLTPREFEVMTLLRKGRTVKEIAYDFGLSHKTVQVHRARILRGMRVDSLVVLANLLNELDLEFDIELSPQPA